MPISAVPNGTGADVRAGFNAQISALEAGIQTNDVIKFSTGGVAPTYTGTPSRAITGYAAGQEWLVAFHSDGTTGSNTLNICGLGALALKQFDPRGSLVDGKVKAGMVSRVYNNGSYLLILDPLPAAGGGGGFKKIRASCNGASSTIVFTADRIVVRDASGSGIELASLSLSLNTATVGAGGMQSAIAVSASYDWGVIYDPASGASALFAWPVGTTPTLPGTYTHWFVCGAFSSNASRYPIACVWADEHCDFVASRTTGDRPILCHGVLGGWGNHVAVSLAPYVPPRAKAVDLTIGNAYLSRSRAQISVSKNNDYYDFRDSEGILSQIYLNNDSAEVFSYLMILESNNIYVRSDAAGGWVGLNGYIDSL